MESKGFKALLQYLAELRNVGARRQSICGPANANVSGNHVTCIQCSLGRASQLQEFVIAQLPNPNQDSNPNHHQHRSQRGASRIEEKKTEQAKARANPVQHQDGLPVRNTPAKQLVMNVLAVSVE